MSQNVPSLNLIAREVRAEREAMVRHVDSLDTKAGVVLGFSGGLAALATVRIAWWRVPGVTLAIASAVLALITLTPRRFPTLDIRQLRDRYLTSEEPFTELRLLDTGIDRIEGMRRLAQYKGRRLIWAARLLVAAIALLAAGTIVLITGG